MNNSDPILGEKDVIDDVYDHEDIINTTSSLPSQLKTNWHEVSTTWNIGPKMTREEVFFNN
jgi:hypothetical protein